MKGGNCGASGETSCGKNGSSCRKTGTSSCCAGEKNSENGDMDGKFSANGANLSFAGCGFLGIYHVGAATCFKQYAPQLLEGKIAGASAGALVACCLICGCCMGDCTTFVLKLAMEARSRTLGPLSPRFRLVKYLREALNAFLPDNAHEICTGRLHVSLTRVSDRENVVVSEFPSKANLIDALICSSFVPLYSGIIPPTHNNVRYIDGAVSDNLPILDENTITVSPFAGESDICPEDLSCHFHHIHLGGTSVQFTAYNLFRMSVAFFPPCPEKLSDMCRQGFEDALRYLTKSNMITCALHLNFCSNIITDKPVKYSLIDKKTTSSSSSRQAQRQPVNQTELSEGEESDDEASDDWSSCDECQERARTCVGDVPPLKVERALKAACDEENSGLFAPLYKHTAYKVASIMAVPYLLPLEVMYNLVRKMMLSLDKKFLGFKSVKATNCGHDKPLYLSLPSDHKAARGVYVVFYEWSPYMSEDMQWFFKELYRLITELMQSIHENKHLNFWELFSLKFYLGFNMFPGMKGKKSPKRTPSLHSIPSLSSLGLPSPQSPPSGGQRSRRGSLKSHRRHKTSVVTYEGPTDLDCDMEEAGAHKDEDGISVDVNFGININYSVTDNPLKCVSNVRRQLLEEGRTSTIASRTSSTWSLASVETVASGGGEEGESSTDGAVGHDELARAMLSINQSADIDNRSPSPFSNLSTVGDSSFDEVLHVADQMDSILSYYYSEENDPTKIRVVEIFPLQKRHERLRHASGGVNTVTNQASPVRKKSRKISHVLLHP